jgi:transcriptional regulator with GAF, ATPase, and Fis domain
MMTNPQLVAIAGPYNGQLFTLDSEEVTIGRDPANQICLNDPLVSRRHCVLRESVDNYVLQDLDSSNGTTINDVPIRTRKLVQGDRIKIGETHFLYVSSENEAALTTFEGHLDDGRVVVNKSYTIRPNEALYLQPEQVTTALPSPNVARNLHALLKISTAINQIRKLPELQRHLLELIIEVIPAERGAIILSKEYFSLSEPFVGFDRVDGWQQGFRVSRTAIEWVRRERVAILSNDVADNLPFGQAKSLVMRQVRALLAVPLVLDEQQLGVIYLDSSEVEFNFKEDHLQLLTAIAAIAAVAFDNVRRVEWLENETRRLRDEISLNHDLIGESAAMQAVYQTLAKVAPSDSTVMLRGESGTGKEMVARALHQGSPRADKPFIAINCAGLSDTLLESDLFGHEKGAFTGAVAQKKGKLEIADGGTVFLDELGELPLPLQAKLLRALQTREFERVGGTRKIKVDIRIIAATNRDLEGAIKDGGFRADLYYRLNVVAITLPPLRDRRDDIPLLANYFATKFGQRCNRQIKGMAPATRALLMNYDWPGNVRELENTIERAVVLGATDFILPEDLPDALHEASAPPNITPTAYHSATRDAKKQIVLQALEESGGNFTQAAKQLGIHPNNMHRLVRNLGLKPQLKK